MNKRSSSAAKSVCLVGICAATLECVKLALAFIPNVEGVTLLTALYGYAFGIYGVISSLVFVSIEPMIYGFGSWVISYYLYWPVLAATFALLGRLKRGGRIIPTVTALLGTLWFGVLTSLVEVGLFSGYFDNFLYRFWIYYVRGLPFYIAQLVTNLVLFPLIFPYLSEKLQAMYKKFTS